MPAVTSLHNFKDGKVAVLHDKTPYGQGLADETKKATNAAGVTEAMYEGVNIGDKDFSALITKMKDAGVNFVYWGGLHTEFGLLKRQAADAGLTATFMSGDGIVSNELASIAGPAVEGTLMTFAPDPRKNVAEAKDIVEEVPRCRLRTRSLHAVLLRCPADRRWRRWQGWQVGRRPGCC